MSMVNANKYGFRKTLNFMLGIFTGFFIIMLISGYFNLLLFNIMPKVKIFMGAIGALYMTYLAVKIMKSKDAKKNDDDMRLNSFTAGMTMQFINPKVILYGITIVSNFIIPFYKSNIALIGFSILLAMVAFMSISCWAMFGVLFEKLLSEYRKPFNIVMGLLLLYSAISISGITHIF